MTSAGSIALKAYEIALGVDEASLLDGLTGVQRVLFSWAQVWRAVTRDAEAVRRPAVDPHSPPDLRGQPDAGDRRFGSTCGVR